VRLEANDIICIRMLTIKVLRQSMGNVYRVFTYFKSSYIM